MQQLLLVRIVSTCFVHRDALPNTHFSFTIYKCSKILKVFILFIKIKIGSDLILFCILHFSILLIF